MPPRAAELVGELHAGGRRADDEHTALGQALRIAVVERRDGRDRRRYGVAERRHAGRVTRAARDDEAAALELALRRGNAVAVVGRPRFHDLGVPADRRVDSGRKAADEVDDLAHRHEAVWVVALVPVTGQTALRVRREQPQRVPTLAAPGVRDVAALEDNVLDRALGEHAAHREPGVPCADDDDGDAFYRQENLPRRRSALLANLDRNVRRVRDDVVHGRSLLRLRDERFDVLLRGVGVYVERHLDVVVAVAHVAVDTEDALDVHRAFELRFHGTQLNTAVLRDGRDAGGEAARKTREHELDGCRAAILRRKDLGMIRLERELGAVLLLLPEAEKVLDECAAARALLPFASGAPGEFRRFGRLAQSFTRLEQGAYIHTIVYRRGHGESPC